MSMPDALQLDDLPTLLARLRQDRFYGSLEVRFEAGDVVLLKKTETIKPHELVPSTLSRQSRGHDGSRKR
jgi:hypothetical protein